MLSVCWLVHVCVGAFGIKFQLLSLDGLSVVSKVTTS